MALGAALQCLGSLGLTRGLFCLGTDLPGVALGAGRPPLPRRSGKDTYLEAASLQHISGAAIECRIAQAAWAPSRSPRLEWSEQPGHMEDPGACRRPGAWNLWRPLSLQGVAGRHPMAFPSQGLGLELLREGTGYKFWRHLCSTHKSQSRNKVLEHF